MANDMRQAVRKHYAETAKGSSCCGGESGGCCCGGPEDASLAIGYQPEDLASIPAEANLGLGCGNPTAIATLEPGQTVVDLGSGGGIDCFLAAGKVGPAGRVIGVDMTPEMIDRARDAAARGSYGNVEFRLGEIEHLPVADATADAVISNCVINLSPDKPQVFRESFRVLKPGGKLMVSDIVTHGEVPQAVRSDAGMYAGCVGGAISKEEYLGAIREAGFTSVRVVTESAALDVVNVYFHERLMEVTAIREYLDELASA